MYNRYLQNDRGTYVRIPEEDGPRSHDRPRPDPPPLPDPPPPRPNPPPPHPEPPPGGDSLSAFLRRFLDRFHLEQVDTGDLLLLGILLLLSSEDADEELIMALGLLLIL